VPRLPGAPTALKANPPGLLVVVGAGCGARAAFTAFGTMKASRSPHPALCPNTLVTSRGGNERGRALAQLPSSFLLA